MTRTLRTRVAPALGVVLALFAGSAVAAGLAPTAAGDRPQVAVVVTGTPRDVTEAKRAAARAGAQVRVPLTTTDQLGVTHMLAARGYDRIVTIGLDRRIAIAPVAERYPGVRFVESTASGLDVALASAGRR